MLTGETRGTKETKWTNSGSKLKAQREISYWVIRINAERTEDIKQR
jgi:hypothetical protein